MKNIVIIGGGFAGSFIARKLENRFKVTLIDNKDYFEFTPGILRSVIKPEVIERLRVKHTDYLKKSVIIKSNFSFVNKDHVMVNDKKIAFDYLCICSGSSYKQIQSDELINPTRSSELISAQSKLKDSKRILIIGGGVVGVELAAEICTMYSDKDITIVHAKDRLIERSNESAIKCSEKFLENHGVKIIYNERLVSKSNGLFITDKGTNIEADITFICTGLKPNCDPLKKNCSFMLNEKEQIMINDFIQVKDSQNIFAPGDANNLNVEKTAQNALIQAKIVVKNIIAIENGKKLTRYEISPTPNIISLGKWKGIFVWKNFSFYGSIPAFIKQFIELKELASLRI